MALRCPECGKILPAFACMYCGKRVVAPKGEFEGGGKTRWLWALIVLLAAALLWALLTRGG